jgi:hypothetical protein
LSGGCCSVRCAAGGWKLSAMRVCASVSVAMLISTLSRNRLCRIRGSL